MVDYCIVVLRVIYSFYDYTNKGNREKLKQMGKFIAITIKTLQYFANLAQTNSVSHTLHETFLNPSKIKI